jgi:hypothetical protein
MSTRPLPSPRSLAEASEHASAHPWVEPRRSDELRGEGQLVPLTSTTAPAQPSRFGDAHIRAALRTRLARHLHHGDAVLLEELGLCRGQVRADVTLVNGSLHAYEIKSDRDTLDRLLRQASIYDKVFDRVTLVVGPRHQPAALELIPPGGACSGSSRRPGARAFEPCVAASATARSTHAPSSSCSGSTTPSSCWSDGGHVVFHVDVLPTGSGSATPG